MCVCVWIGMTDEMRKRKKQAESSVILCPVPIGIVVLFLGCRVFLPSKVSHFRAVSSVREGELEADFLFPLFSYCN
jgi:hypothetical protein